MLIGSYSSTLVFISLCVAILASYTALDLTGRVPQGRLAGKALADARFGFSGQLSPDGALAGALDGTASLDGAAISLAGDLASDETGRRLSGLQFSAGPTQLTGALAQDETGLITGELVLASPDISTAAALLALSLLLHLEDG